MPDREQNNQNDFMIEKIKQRPINRRKLLRRTMITAAMAVIFGLIACVTFLVLEPVISNWLYPEPVEEPQTVTFPEDSEEMSPEEMLAENIPEETPPSETEQESVVLEEEQIREILSGVTLNRKNYGELYSAMSSYVEELSRYMVTVTAVTSNIDWFNNVEESSNQTSGIMIQENGMELLILTDATTLQKAESLILTFDNGAQADARIKQTDSYTNLAVLSVAFDALPPEIKVEEMVFPSLGSSNTINMLGMPVIAMGSPMGISNSIGYGMITSTKATYSVPDRNYQIIQTDISGSQNASGVLFNLEGQVIGIITEKKSGFDVKDVIYAYGITELRKLLEKMSNDEAMAYLGVSGLSVPIQTSVESGVPAGAFVKKVEMDSPAMREGIQQGDVITNINGRRISTFNEYTSVLMQLEPEQTVEMTVMRQSQDEYKEMKFSIETGEVKVKK